MKIAICFEYPKSSSPDVQDVIYQAEFLEKYLKERHQTERVVYKGDFVSFIKELKGFNAAWNLFESLDGKEESAFMATLLFESANLPYTGNVHDPLFTTANKPLTKWELEQRGIPIPSEEFVPKERYIIKNGFTHGSLGITDDSVVYADTREELKAYCAKLGPFYFFERYIEGRELAVSLLDMGKGLDVLGVAEMKFVNYPEGKPKILNFDSKWNESADEYNNTVRSFDVEKGIADRAAELSLKTAEALKLNGFARVDFRLDEGGDLYVIDVNPNPALGEHAGFIACAKEKGLSAEDTLEYILKEALGKKK